jgi:hypothetical protein
MTKYKILFLSILASSLLMYGQETFKKFEMHYYVGPTINNVSKSDYGNTGITEKVKNSLGFNLGVLPYWKFSKFLHLRFGLGYNLRNFKYELTGLTFYNPNTSTFVEGSSTSSIHINAIQLPIHIVINPPDNGVYGFIGADFNYCFQGNSKSTIDEGNNVITEFNRKLDPQFNPSLDFGIGTFVKVGGSSQTFNLEVYFSVLTKEIAPLSKSGQSMGLKVILYPFWKK